MKFDNIEKLFDKSYNYDKKHKINTTDKELPESVIKTINSGVTVEQLDLLLSKGFDVYKYSTQITIHGKCDKLTNDTVGYYKCLTLNKNKSIGVKWIAVDAAKKENICRTLSLFGWSSVHDSQLFYPCKIERFSNKSDAVKRCNEYKEIANRIDNSLFYGSYDIFVGTVWGMYYSVFNLYVNGIYKENVNTLLEQITGLDVDGIEIEKQKAKKKKQEEHERIEREYQETRKRELANGKKKMEQIKSTLLNKGYKEVISTSLCPGDQFVFVEDCFGYVSAKEYVYGKRTCKPAEGFGMNAQQFCKKPIVVWAK